MKLRKSRLKHYFEYSLLRSAVFVVNLFPEPCIQFFCTVIGYCTWIFIPFRLRVAYYNISNVFPEKKHNEKLQLLKSAYVNVCRTFGLIFILHRPQFRAIIQNAQVTGLEKIEAALQKKKGIILTTYHGCWFEGYFAWFNLSTLPVSLIYQKQANPFADAFFVRQRQHFGKNLEHISSWEGMKQYEAALKKGRLLIVSLDQNYTDKGTPVQFFDKTLSCAKGAGILHLRTEAPVFTSVYYMKNGVFHIDFDEVLLPEYTDINEQNINNICTESIKSYENFIRDYPEQWFSIFHRLWSKRKQDYPKVFRSIKDI